MNVETVGFVFGLGKYTVNISKVISKPKIHYMMFLHGPNGYCDHLPSQPNQRAAIYEAKRILREKAQCDTSQEKDQ